MKCLSCDKILKDHESKRKGLFSKEYVDLCDKCLEPVKHDIPLSTGNSDLDEVLIEEITDEHRTALD